MLWGTPRRACDAPQMAHWGPVVVVRRPKLHRGPRRPPRASRADASWWKADPVFRAPRPHRPAPRCHRPLPPSLGCQPGRRSLTSHHELRHQPGAPAGAAAAAAVGGQQIALCHGHAWPWALLHRRGEGGGDSAASLQCSELRGHSRRGQRPVGRALPSGGREVPMRTGAERTSAHCCWCTSPPLPLPRHSAAAATAELEVQRHPGIGQVPCGGAQCRCGHAKPCSFKCC